MRVKKKGVLSWAGEVVGKKEIGRREGRKEERKELADKGSAGGSGYRGGWHSCCWMGEGGPWESSGEVASRWGRVATGGGGRDCVFVDGRGIRLGSC